MVRRLSPLVLLACLILLFSLYAVRGNVASAQAPTVEQTNTARAPVGSGFTYQGRLTFGGAPAVGEYDFQFRLYDGPDAGSTQVGDTETREDVTVTDGTFTVYLDFGSAAFDGEGRWLELAVRPSDPTDSAPYNTLSPRQPLTPTPYALHAAKAGSVAWSGVTGVPDTLSFLAAPSPCASGQVPKWDGSAWACAADEDSGGDITGVAAGTGLSGGGTSGDVTLSADTSYLQRRVSTDCAAGSSIRSIAEDGTVTCEPDDAGPDPQQVEWVAKSGGDFTSVQAALDSITDASADKPYLIRIAPGIYTEQVTLKPFVALEGAGEGKTILRWTGGTANPLSTGGSATVIGANNAELRLLTIESVAGTGTQFTTVLWNSGTSPTLIHVTATASGGTRNYGVFNVSFSSPPMTNVTVTASGGNYNYGVSNSSSSSPTMDNVTVTASGGGFQNHGVSNESSSPTMENVTTSASGGSFNYGVSNSSSSPKMDNVTATASGASFNYGVSNESSSPTMDNVTASASGGTLNIGVYNLGSSPTMDNVTATASGGNGFNYGVSNSSSSPTMDNVTATASGGSSDNIGVSNESSSSPTIRDSALTGSTNSVYRSGGTVRVANSQLVGAVSNGVTCFDNYNANLAPVTCP